VGAGVLTVEQQGRTTHPNVTQLPPSLTHPVLIDGSLNNDRELSALSCDYDESPRARLQAVRTDYGEPIKYPIDRGKRLPSISGGRQTRFVL
jgi:hypothetical protein